jgi:hypothetical protein
MPHGNVEYWSILHKNKVSEGDKLSLPKIYHVGSLGRTVYTFCRRLGFLTKKSEDPGWYLTLKAAEEPICKPNLLLTSLNSKVYIWTATLYVSDLGNLQAYFNMLARYVHTLTICRCTSLWIWGLVVGDQGDTGNVDFLVFNLHSKSLIA